MDVNPLQVGCRLRVRRVAYCDRHFSLVIRTVTAAIKALHVNFFDPQSPFVFFSPQPSLSRQDSYIDHFLCRAPTQRAAVDNESSIGVLSLSLSLSDSPNVLIQRDLPT
jgi:hypothetical protein